MSVSVRNTRLAVEPEMLLTSGEVALLFRVDPKTVARWARIGKLASARTLGGHRRFRAADIHALLDTSGATEE